MKTKTQSLFDIFEVKADAGNEYVAVPAKPGSRSNPPANVIRELGLVKGATDPQEAISIAVNGETVFASNE